MNIESVYQSLRLANPWWEGKSIPAAYRFPYQRPQLKKMISHQALGRIVVIKGPRRTGKTTLLYQYINHLLQAGVNPQAIIYAPMDDLNLRIPIRDLLSAHQALIQDQEPADCYLFLDEVQFLNHWPTELKVIHDRDPSHHFVVSGSSASWWNGRGELPAGEEVLLPFSLRESIEADLVSRSDPQLTSWLAGRSPDLTSITYDPTGARLRPQLERYFRQYLNRGGFPQLLKVERGLLPKLVRTDILQKALYQDLAGLYEIKEPLALERLFLYFVETTAGIANLSLISRQIGLSRQTLAQYIGYLTNAYLLFTVPKYSRDPKEIRRSQKKVHLTDPSFRWLSAGATEDSLVEGLVSSHLLRHNQDGLYYWRHNYELDLVVKTGDSLVPIEVSGRRRPFVPSDYRGLLNFMAKYQARLGLVIYAGEAQEVKLETGVIRMLPAWYFLAHF